MPIRVVLAEDNYLVREGVARLLEREPDLEIVATCDDHDSLLGAVEEHAPDVVLTDIRMPRAPNDWPDLVAQPVPAFDTKLVPADRPLGGLGQALFLGLLALAKEIGQTVPEIAPDTAPTGSEAAAIMSESFGHMFPNLRAST